jgi:hypothetical protein
MCPGTSPRTTGCARPGVPSRLCPARCALTSWREAPNPLVGQRTPPATSLLGMGAVPYRPFPVGNLAALGAGVHLPWLRQRPLVLIVALILFLTAVVVLRHRLRRRGERATFQLLPSRSFEPSIEDVRRFAVAVEARPSFLRRVVGACEATVVRLRRSGPDETAFFLDVPVRLARRIRSTCYTGVEPIEVDLAFSWRGDFEIRELVLRRDAVHPLRHVPLSPDPKGVLTQVLDELEDTELAEVEVVLWPAGQPWHRHLERKRRSQSPSDVLSGMWHEFKQNRPAPRQRRNVPDKAAGAPVFRARIVLRVGAKDRRRARALVSDLTWVFELWHGENSLRPLRPPLRRLKRRLRGRTLPPRRRQFLSLHELAGWLYPPTASCRGRNVARAEAAPAPPSLLVYRTPRDPDGEEES